MPSCFFLIFMSPELVLSSISFAYRKDFIHRSVCFVHFKLPLWGVCLYFQQLFLPLSLLCCFDFFFLPRISLWIESTIEYFCFLDYPRENWVNLGTIQRDRWRENNAQELRLRETSLPPAKCQTQVSQSLFVGENSPPFKGRQDNPGSLQSISHKV